MLPLLAVGIVLLYTSAEAERRVVQETQRSVVMSIAADLDELLKRVESDLLGFGRQVPLTSDDRDQLERNARTFLASQYPDLIDLAILDTSGNEVMRVSTERTYFNTELNNRIEEPFFRPAVEGVIYRSVTTAIDGRRVAEIAVPARNAVGQVIGVVVAQLATERIEQRLAAVPQSTGRSAFVIDEWGTVLLGDPPFQLVDSRDLPTWAASDALVSTLRGTDNHVATAARAPIPPGDWSVVVEQPVEIAFFTSQRNTWILGLMLALTATVVVIWSLLVSRELTRPVLQLRDGVQLLARGQLGGTITVARDDELGQLATEFNTMSERLAESQAAIELRNARLSEGLDLARLVQRDLLPQGPPPSEMIVAHAACEPAIEIGGDFYTYVPLPDGRLRLIIGDASGKGVPAALVMGTTSGFVEIDARRARTPSDLLTQLNVQLYPRFNPSHVCVSLLVAEFDPRTQRVCIANAGMIAPLAIKDGACSYVLASGPPLGVVDNIVYDEITIDLQPNDSMVFISDGIVEARNHDNELWGFKRFEETVCRAAHQGTQAIVDQVLDAVKAHVHGSPPADDMTIIATTLTPSVSKGSSYVVVPYADDRLPVVQPASDRM
jgi:serine phosphatase RsbU (regulator of sigma subunit)